MATLGATLLLLAFVISAYATAASFLLLGCAALYTSWEEIRARAAP